MDENKKIITSPDYDFSRTFKLLLVDFEWEEIAALSNAVKKLPIPVTLFLYGSKDDNPAWCMSQAKQCKSVLLNMKHQGSCELLKGFLLGESNVYTCGYHKLDKIFHRKVIDLASWLALQYEEYCRLMHELEPQSKLQVIYNLKQD